MQTRPWRCLTPGTARMTNSRPKFLGTDLFRGIRRCTTRERRCMRLASTVRFVAPKQSVQRGHCCEVGRAIADVARRPVDRGNFARGIARTPPAGSPDPLDGTGRPGSPCISRATTPSPAPQYGRHLPPTLSRKPSKPIPHLPPTRPSMPRFRSCKPRARTSPGCGPPARAWHAASEHGLSSNPSRTGPLPARK